MFQREKLTDEDREKIRQTIGDGAFSDEELDRMKTLPIRKLRFSGEEHKALYDEANCLIYLLDDKGIPTGEVRRLKQPLAKPTNSEKPEKKPESGIKGLLAIFSKAESKKVPKKKLLGDEEAGGSDDGSDNKPSGGPSRSSKLLAGVAATVLVLICIIYGVSQAVSLSRAKTPAEPPAPAAESQRVNVIKLDQSVLPGEMLSKEHFVKESIGNDKYNELSVSGTVYTWDYADILAEMYATEYIPADTQYLTMKNVSGTAPVYENPFKTLMATDGSTGYLSIPVNLSYENFPNVVIGRYCDMKLEKQTVSSKTEHITTVEDVDFKQTADITEQTRTDTYILNNVKILDIIAFDGTSLYDVFSQYNAVPDGMLEMYCNDMFHAEAQLNQDVGITDMKEIFPKFYGASIVIELPNDQIKAIGKLDSDNTQLVISNLGAFTEDTAVEADYVAQTRFTADVIAKVLTRIAKGK